MMRSLFQKPLFIVGAVATLIMGVGAEVSSSDKKLDCDIDFRFTSTWDKGFVGVISVTNNSNSPIEDWEVSFRSSFTITDDWNGEIVSTKEMEGGREYTYDADAWNAVLDPGETATIGFQGVYDDTLFAPHKLRLNGQECGKQEVQGYYANWSVYSGIYPTDLPLESLDEIVHSFGLITDAGEVTLLDSWADTQMPMPGDTAGQDLYGIFNQYRKIRETHPDLDIVYSIVARGHNKIGFKAASSTPEKRTAFAKSAIDFMKKYNFDGIDMDWEFPEEGDKENCVLLMAELRRQLDIEGFKAGKYYSLSMATAIGPWLIQYTDLGALVPYVDQFSIMGYNFFGPWNKITGPNAALYNNATPDLHLDPELESSLSVFNVDWSVQHHLASGVPAHKLVIIMPAYGQEWTNVKDTLDRNGLYVPGEGKGAILYKDALALLANGYTRYWDEAGKTAWLYNPDVSGGHYVTFHDTEAVAAKCQYMKELGLRGGSFWMLAGDGKGDESLVETTVKEFK